MTEQLIRSVPIAIPNASHVSNNEIKSNSLPVHNIFNTNKQTEHDLNYSVYADSKITLSASPENTSRILPKLNSRWVDSNLLQHCQKCSIIFTFFNRKHHCRACGGVFCYQCCNNYKIIPKFIKIPEHENTYRAYISSSCRRLINGNKELVCTDCDTYIDDLDKLRPYKKKFEEFLIEGDIQLFEYLNKRKADILNDNN